MEQHTDRVERQITLDEPLADVWDAVTDPERLAEWFGATVEWELIEGGRATFTFPDGRERPARIDRVVPEREVAFHYLPVERDVDGSVRKVPGSTVEILIEPLESGTRVRVVETTLYTVATPRFLPPSAPRWHLQARGLVRV